MDDSQSQSSPFSSPNAWADWRWLALLFALVVPLRGWLLWNTEVMARDSVGFIRYALRFDEQPWGEVLRTFDQHPGYPSAIWLVSMPVRAWAGGVTPETMQFSAQLVSALAAMLLLLPMFYLGKALWDARVGFGGALLYQYLPLSGHHLSDGMSESLFVLWIAWGILCALWAVQSGRLRWFAACGVMAGLAYLTRPEGAIVLAAVGLALVAFQFHAAWRQPWLQLSRQGVCLAAPALLVGAFYFVPMGKFTAKPSINRLVAAPARKGDRTSEFKRSCPFFGPTTFAPAEPKPPSPALRAQLWGDSFVDIHSPRQRLLRGLWAILAEVGYSLHYIGLVPLLVGLLWHGKALHRARTGWVVTCYCCLHAAALLVLAASAGYLSDRHLMPLILFLCYLVMIGLLQLAAWAVHWQTRSFRTAAAPARKGDRTSEFKRSCPLFGPALTLLALEIASGLPHTLQRLHHNRAGNHAAGLWLAQQLQPGDLVLDDHDWSHYYAGQVFLERQEPAVAADCRPTCYVVITRSNDPKIAIKRKQWENKLHFSQSQIVYHWPTTNAVDDARIVIHALPRNAKTHPWHIAQK